MAFAVIGIAIALVAGLGIGSLTMKQLVTGKNEKSAVQGIETDEENVLGEVKKEKGVSIEDEEEETDEDEVPEIKVGETWTVDGLWKVTINSVTETEERHTDTSYDGDKNPEAVYIVDYTYENLGYKSDSSGLGIDLSGVYSQIVDSDKEMGYSYYVYVLSKLTSPDYVPVDKDYAVELYEVSGNEELIQLLCKNDLDGVKKWILSFSEELTQSYKNKQFIFLRVYQLLGHLLKFLCDMGLNINDMEKDIIKTYQQLDAFSTSTEIFQWLFRLCQTISDEMNLSTKSHQEHVCAATLEYIQQHYQDNTLCLNEIAENVHISPAHLSALFKKQRQQNISDVIADIRIEAACSLLKNTSLPLKEISAKVGYSNQYYFSSCFKKKTGKTPSSYR